jgi:hypothetical protein
MKKTIVARHRVSDIDAWLKGHQERVELFAPAVSGFKTFLDINDPKSVVLVIEVTDMDKLGDFMNDKHIMCKNR